jgi:hypothetical protein
MANILSFKSDAEIAQVLAQWVAKERLSQNLSQEDIYRRAAIASSTYKKFEQTGETSLVRFIAVLRAIGRLDILEQLLASQPRVSPMQKLTGKQTATRKRARKK